MSFNSLAKSAVCTFMFSSLLCACSELSLERPNHSWFADKSYGTEGQNDADLATVAYSQGNFAEAENYVIQALTVNPKNTQALMVGALVYEKLGRLNRARQYYEDIIIIGGDEMTLLGTDGSTPEKMTEVARKRLRLLNMQITDFMVENHNGTMTFNISKEAAERQGKSAMEEALFVRTQRLIANNQADSQADIKAVEVLFDECEKNMEFLCEEGKKKYEKEFAFLTANARKNNDKGLEPAQIAQLVSKVLRVKNEKCREQEYKQCISDYCPENWVKVLKTLYKRTKSRGSITSMDKKYQILLEHALYSEFSFALGIPASEMTRFIADHMGEKTN